MTAMAKFTGLRATLVVGGAKNVSSQVSDDCFINGVQERLPFCHGDLTFRSQRKMVTTLRQWV